MKFLNTAVLLAMVAPGAAQTSSVQNLRRKAQGNGNGNANGLRKSMVPCTILLSDIQYADHHEEETPLECELVGEDLDGQYFRLVKVKGVPPGFAKAKGLESGISTIFAPGSDIDDANGELIIQQGAEISIGRRKSNNKGGGQVQEGDSWLDNDRKLAQLGNKKILVLRVVASDAMTTGTEAELSDDVFGTSGDPVNIKSQYEACSYEKLTWDKVTNNNVIGDDSVYTVAIPNTVIGSDNGAIRDAAVNQAAAELGASLNTIADYVMVCVPPGSNGGWIAYAYVNYYLSVYNDNWCRHLSGQMHEIGHNLGLAHSGETAAYDDQSGMMGYSYSQDNGPLMCFNGPKTYQLGWFPEYHVDLNAGSSSFSWTGDLIGFAEKEEGAAGDMMIIKITAEASSTDAYVHYNRKTGFNSGSVEGGDQVLVATRAEGLGYAVSAEKAKLSAGGTYTINEFNGVGSNDLVISVVDIDKGGAPHRATITITYGNAAPDPTPAPFPDPTPAPVPDPTPQPVPDPTPAPVPDPTPQPVPDPTPAPVPDPTPQPVPDPTPAPVSDPTPQPVPDPTWSPVPEDPTPAPVPAPTPAPVPAPSCNNDGICALGEDCNSCPNDCLGQGNVCCVGGECDSFKCNKASGKSQWICVKSGQI